MKAPRANQQQIDAEFCVAEGPVQPGDAVWADTRCVLLVVNVESGSSLQEVQQAFLPQVRRAVRGSTMLMIVAAHPGSAGPAPR